MSSRRISIILFDEDQERIKRLQARLGTKQIISAIRYALYIADQHSDEQDRAMQMLRESEIEHKVSYTK